MRPKDVSGRYSRYESYLRAAYGLGVDTLMYHSELDPMRHYGIMANNDIEAPNNMILEEDINNMILDPSIAKKGKEIVTSKALHPEFMADLAKVARVSELKGYEPFNWLKEGSGIKVSTLLEAAARHIKNGTKGYNVNIEKTPDGKEIDIAVHDFAYAAYNLLMATRIIMELPQNDDRLFAEGKLK